MNVTRTYPERFELCYVSLFNSGRGFAFPCDAKGRVDLDSLSDQAKANYFYARALVGREFCVPQVQREVARDPMSRQP